MFDCLDCRVNTLETGEYYAVRNNVWRNSGADKGVLCIGCLEKRLKRRLTPEDFTDSVINSVSFSLYGHSKRLQSRMTQRQRASV